MNIAGVGKDAPIKKDGSGSVLPYRMDLMPPAATLAVSQVFAEGFKKYARCPEHKHLVGKDVDCRNCDAVEDSGWKSIPARDHLNHAFIHGMAYLAGDETDDHAEHFGCRALMFLDAVLRENL